MDAERRLTTGDVMKYCSVSRSTVLKWIKSEKLDAYLHPHGQYRIPQAALVAFLREYNMPIDKELLRGKNKPTPDRKKGENCENNKRKK